MQAGHQWLTNKKPGHAPAAVAPLRIPGAVGVHPLGLPRVATPTRANTAAMATGAHGIHVREARKRNRRLKIPAVAEAAATRVQPSVGSGRCPVLQAHELTGIDVAAHPAQLENERAGHLPHQAAVKNSGVALMLLHSTRRLYGLRHSRRPNECTRAIRFLRYQCCRCHIILMLHPPSRVA